MKILVIGNPKTGTSILFYKIKNSLPESTRTEFEPAKYKPQPKDNETGVLMKTLILSAQKADYNSFKEFDKKILLIRDPRDMLVSAILFIQWATNAFKDKKFIDKFVKILKKKERSVY